MKKYIFIIVLTFVSVGFLKAQDEPVYWLHGFQFDTIPTNDVAPGRWDLYALKFSQERKINSFNPNYARTNNEVTGGIANAANVLAAQMTNNSKSVLIAHSMGGLVARRLDAATNRTIGGIVTVGTGHNGARIATNLQNGNVVAAAERGFNDLVRGPAATSINMIGIVFPIVHTFLTPEGLTNLLWDNVLEERLMRALPPVNSATLRDLMPGSNLINNLNSSNTNVPLINVVLKETNHQFLRMGTSAVLEPELQDLHSHDDGLLNSARTQTKSWYKGLKDYYLTLRFAQPLLYNKYNRIAGYYRDGESYLDHKLETDYNSLNGSNSFESVTIYTDVWVCGNNNPGGLSGGRSAAMPIEPLPDPVDCEIWDDSEECSTCRWETRAQTTYTTVNYDHDGLVPVNAQTPTVRTSATYQTTSVNHMEVGNHPEMTDVMNRIFSRRAEVFFRDRRQ